MNGDERKYFDELLEKLDKKLSETRDAVLKLPCKVHLEKFKGLAISVDRAWKFIYGIIIIFLLSGVGLLIVRTVMASK